MSEELMKDAIEMFRDGNLEGAVAELEEKVKSNPDVADLHHTYAEFANMLNMEEQEDIVPGGKIMMHYKNSSSFTCNFYLPYNILIPFY